MDQEIKHILEHQAELLDDNNKMLKKLVRAQRWSVFITTLKWVIIIGVSLGIYAILQPMLESLLQTYSGLLSGVDEIKESGSALPDVSKYFNILNGE